MYNIIIIIYDIIVLSTVIIINTVNVWLLYYILQPLNISAVVSLEYKDIPLDNSILQIVAKPLVIWEELHWHLNGCNTDEKEIRQIHAHNYKAQNTSTASTELKRMEKLHP